MNTKVLFRKDLREMIVSKKVLILLGVFIFCLVRPAVCEV